MAGRHGHLRGLATAIHEISGLGMREVGFHAGNSIAILTCDGADGSGDKDTMDGTRDRTKDRTRGHKSKGNRA
jgi:hypothetical protein